MRSIHVGRLQAVAVPVVLDLSLAVPTAVAAHAEFEEASPADGATVDGNPAEIVAVFSEALAANGSVLTLRDAAGLELVHRGLDPDDPARLVITDVPELTPGEYEVCWTAASDDGHLERDTWTFTVVAAPRPSPSPTPATTAPPPPHDPGATDADVVIPIVAGLASVAIAGAILFSRRDRA